MPLLGCSRHCHSLFSSCMYPQAYHLSEINVLGVLYQYYCHSFHKTGRNRVEHNKPKFLWNRSWITYQIYVISPVTMTTFYYYSENHQSSLPRNSFSKYTCITLIHHNQIWPPFSWSIFIRAVKDHMICYNLNWSKIKLWVHYFVFSCTLDHILKS